MRFCFHSPLLVSSPPTFTTCIISQLLPHLNKFSEMKNGLLDSLVEFEDNSRNQ